MKKFKDFRNTNIPDDSIVFANAGGPKDQYNNFGMNNSEKIDKSVVFANAGGHKDQYKHFNKNIKENLNPRNEPQSIRSGSEIFLDPDKNNEGIGNHHPKVLGIPEGDVFGHVHPHFTDEHAKHIKALLGHVNSEFPYHEIVDEYTATSKPLNHALYVAAKFGSPPPKKVDMSSGFPIHIKHIDDLIAKHKLPHDMTVYSGLHFDPNEHKGKVVKLPAYTSVSVSPHVAKDFGESYDSEDENGRWVVNKHIMRLHLPKGHPHLLTDMGSQFPGQGELILPRGMKLQMGTKPTHIITGNFNSHFDDEPRFGSIKTFHHIWNARILPK